MKYTFDRCASHILVHVQDESSSLSHLPIAYGRQPFFLWLARVAAF